ncbi:MAG: ATP-binding cassette domain-containing protein [Cyclobacteriaceae bacterium]|nr:ATP-binding cassette domain-containing protein [Cyclobacteriaceae bacterium]
MIRAKNIEQNVHLGKRESILKHLNFHIEKGEFVAFISKNVENKSALLKIIGLLTPIDKGQLTLNSINVTNLSPTKKMALRIRNIGFVFSEPLLIDELSVFENVELPLIYLKLNRKTRKKYVENVLKQLNLLHRKNYYPRQLSKEWQQQVAIARAFVIKPKIILADEPIAKLSMFGGEEVMKRLAQINEQQVTIVITSNSIEKASYAQKLFFIERGEVIIDKNY